MGFYTDEPEYTENRFYNPVLKDGATTFRLYAVPDNLKELVLVGVMFDEDKAKAWCDEA